jgi:hypothetical protein
MKSSRIDIRVTEDLLARVDARCEELGQSRTKFIERALELALGPRESVIVRAQAGEFERPKPEVEFDLRAAAMERQRAMNKAKGL